MDDLHLHLHVCLSVVRRAKLGVSLTPWPRPKSGAGSCLYLTHAAWAPDGSGVGYGKGGL